MDSDEARAVLAGHLSRYRATPYRKLVERIGTVDVAERRGQSGAVYQIEVEVRWDSTPDAGIRVIGSIDDGGWQAMKPLCDDFILGPDGKFVGE